MLAAKHVQDLLRFRDTIKTCEAQLQVLRCRQDQIDALISSFGSPKPPKKSESLLSSVSQTPSLSPPKTVPNFAEFDKNFNEIEQDKAVKKEEFLSKNASRKDENHNKNAAKKDENINKNINLVDLRKKNEETLGLSDFNILKRKNSVEGKNSIEYLHTRKKSKEKLILKSQDHSPREKPDKEPEIDHSKEPDSLRRPLYASKPQEPPQKNPEPINRKLLVQTIFKDRTPVVKLLSPNQKVVESKHFKKRLENLQKSSLKTYASFTNLQTQKLHPLVRLTKDFPSAIERPTESFSKPTRSLSRRNLNHSLDSHFRNSKTPTEASKKLKNIIIDPSSTSNCPPKLSINIQQTPSSQHKVFESQSKEQVQASPIYTPSVEPSVDDLQHLFPSKPTKNPETPSSALLIPLKNSPDTKVKKELPIAKPLPPEKRAKNSKKNSVESKPSSRQTPIEFNVTPEQSSDSHREKLANGSVKMESKTSIIVPKSPNKVNLMATLKEPSRKDLSIGSNTKFGSFLFKTTNPCRNSFHRLSSSGKLPRSGSKPNIQIIKQLLKEAENLPSETIVSVNRATSHQYKPSFTETDPLMTNPKLRILMKRYKNTQNGNGDLYHPVNQSRERASLTRINHKESKKEKQRQSSLGRISGVQNIEAGLNLFVFENAKREANEELKKSAKRKDLKESSLEKQEKEDRNSSEETSKKMMFDEFLKNEEKCSIPKKSHENKQKDPSKIETKLIPLYPSSK